jgi:hypothetical protein
MNAIDPQDLEILARDANQGYGLGPLPRVRDAQIGQIIDRLGQNEFASLQEFFDSDHADMLLAFAERMASLAVRRQSRQDIHRGLLAAGIAASLSIDSREVILILPLMWHSAEIIGLDPCQEFVLVAEELKGDAGVFLETFTLRSARDRDIQVMGYIESVDEEGFRYRRTW